MAPPGGGTYDPNAPDPGVDVTCETPQVDGTPLTHLTRAEYDRTVADLLGIDSTAARGFAPDENTDGYEVGSRVSPLLAEQYVDAAEALSQRAVDENLDGLVPCDPAAGDEDCAREFIDGFAPRAFRRPATSEEIEGLLALYRTGATYDFATGIQAVVMGALSSSGFLYHVELSPEDARTRDVVELDDYAVASRLSYFLWGSMPDDELFRAAGAGELRDANGLETQARRMLEHENAANGLHSFARQWLGLDKIDGMQRDPERYPEWNDSMRERLRASMDGYLDEVFLGDEPTVDNLLTGTFGYMDPELASALSIDGVEGEGTQRVELDPAQRRGLLSQPALLAVLSKPNQSDPIHRGVFVRTRLLCQNLPPPPDDIAVVAPDPAPGLSTRERFAEHSSNTRCQGCHQLIDPIGFGFEHYDAMGRWRELDEGAPVDASGEVFNSVDAEGPFYGVPELSEQLAASDEVRQCVGRQLFRFAMGRTETDRDFCAMSQIQQDFASSGYDLRELMVAIARSEAFRYLSVPSGANR